MLPRFRRSNRHLYSPPARGWLIASLVALGVIIAINVAYWLIQPPNSAPKIAKSQPANVPISSLLATIQSHITRSYPSLQTLSQPDSSNTLGYPWPGSGFSIVLPFSPHHAITFLPGSSAATHYLPAAAKLASSALVGAGFQMSFGPTSLLQVSYFHGPHDVCQITTYQKLDIVCAPIVAIASIAKTATPLIATYRLADHPSGSLTIEAPTISASPTPGYMRASLPVFSSNSETNVLFYRSTSSPWQTVNLLWYNDPHQDGDILPNCADFESLDALRSAYKGQTCYDSASRSIQTVR